MSLSPVIEPFSPSILILEFPSLDLTSIIPPSVSLLGFIDTESFPSLLFNVIPSFPIDVLVLSVDLSSFGPNVSLSAVRLALPLSLVTSTPSVLIFSISVALLTISFFFFNSSNLVFN
ncbi:hypothetical protein [Streptobacillus moniliformis]|uniref:hypothetical protein n=1 Tax=Streptobacillus moniliformis TaxID=34105 RepID=UPI0007E3DF1E